MNPDWHRSETAKINSYLRESVFICGLDIQIPDIQGVVFDKFAARFDGVAH